MVDSPDDTTVPVVAEYARKEPRLRCIVNTYGRGPANAIRFGIDAAAAPVAVVTMADGCDDPRQIDDLARLVDRGVVVAAASRYMPGGQQVGGPLLKGLLSRAAGRSLALFARIGTRDATNSFKAYSTEFVQAGRHRLRDGFEIGIELTAKARRMRLPVAEIPTIWLDRQAGRVELQGRAVDSRVPALVPLRIRSQAHRRADQGLRAADKERSRTRNEGSGQRVGRVHRRLRRGGAARPGLRRSSASTTSPSTGRSPSPTTATRTTSSSRATAATSS